MRLLLVLIVWLIWWAPAFAEIVVITQPWVQVRAQPKLTAKAIAIVYGNDSYEMLDEREQWVRIRAVAKPGRAKVSGWVPRNVVYPIIEPIARKALAYGVELKNAGKEREARAKLFEVMRRFPGTIQSYEATRLLLGYHPGRGPLPEPTDGKLEPRAKAEAERLASWLLIEEGRLLIREKRYQEAVSMFEEARTRGKMNRTAMDGIREALQTEYRDAASSSDRERAELALKSYFPGVQDPETFRIDPLGKPEPQPPTMAPLVPPPPPIPDEEQMPPALHDFEQKELELAPQAQGPGPSPAPETPGSEQAGKPQAQGSETMPRPREPGSEAMPKPEEPRSKPKPLRQAQVLEPEQIPSAPGPGSSAALQGDSDDAATSLQREILTPGNPDAMETAPHPASGHPPENAEPGALKRGADSRAPAKPEGAPRPPRRSTPKGEAMLPEPLPQAGPAIPQDVPPGFPAPATAQVRPTAASKPAMKGLWPAGDGGTAAAQRPTPPPSFSELAERPPSAAAR